MKKALFIPIFAMSITSVNAQIMKIYKDGTLIKEYKSSEANKVVFEEETSADENLLPGKFSVSATKQVQFTKGNLYWNGSEFRFEENQTDYPTVWNANHVGHFYWTNLTDYQSGKAEYMPYATNFSYSSMSKNDNFWCTENNPLKVEGTDNLYPLKGSYIYNGEWEYLIRYRTNADKLYKNGVSITIGSKTTNNCLLIAPDECLNNYNFNSLKTSYTEAEWKIAEDAGVICLPAAGYRKDNIVNQNGGGYYWTTWPDTDDWSYDMDFNANYNEICAYCQCNRYYSLCMRLVHTVK